MFAYEIAYLLALVATEEVEHKVVIRVHMYSDNCFENHSTLATWTLNPQAFATKTYAQNPQPETLNPGLGSSVHDPQHLLALVACEEVQHKVDLVDRF